MHNFSHFLWGNLFVFSHTEGVEICASFGALDGMGLAIVLYAKARKFALLTEQKFVRFSLFATEIKIVPILL